MDLMGIYELKSIAGFYSGGAILVEATSSSNPLYYVADRLGSDTIFNCTRSDGRLAHSSRAGRLVFTMFFSAGKTPEIVVINRGVTLIQTLLNKRRNF
jgi:hypothetical protein